MATAAFTTLGCKVNQYETQSILESFEAAGFSVVPFDSVADVYVINTCSVTAIAESKSRATVRKAARNNPLAKIVVTGCGGQMALNQGVSYPGADLLVPNPNKLETYREFARTFPELADKARNDPRAEPSPGLNRTRATLKLQDGCSVMCSYCSIPYTRPGLVSRPQDQVLDEARRLLDMGYRELILTGVLIGAYGPDSGSGGPDFETIVQRIADLDPESRVRISSIEMRQVSDRLIKLLQAGAVVPHLHIPLQSGDSGVLSDMNRPYTQQNYLDLCDRLRSAVPGISITTDIMVGFPTETDERFESTLEVCRRARYLKAHVFRFSPRPGTPADQWGDPIAPEMKQRRSLEIARISQATAAEHARDRIGQIKRVLVEGKVRTDGLLEGLSDDYFEVRFPGPRSLMKQFAWVQILESDGSALIGEQVATQTAAKKWDARHLPLQMLGGIKSSMRP